jgi:hypothetical protein
MSVPTKGAARGKAGLFTTVFRKISVRSAIFRALVFINMTYRGKTKEVQVWPR